MNAIRHSTFFLRLMLLTQICSGQDTLGTLYFDQLTINEGLSHNTVLSILQDKYGYIWIGTQNGLNKYDGYTFKVYQSLEQTDGEEGFIGKYISALFEDKAGNLWVGTRKNGINIKRSASSRFVNLQSDPAFVAIKGYEVSSFFEDKAGSIWITTTGAGILKYDPHTRTSHLFTEENSQLSNNITFDVVEDKYGTIWVAAIGERLNVLEGDQFVMSHERSTVISNMWGYRKKLLLDDDYLWIGTDGTGLYRMNIDDRKYTHFAAEANENAISSNVIRDLYLQEGGRLFIATDGNGLASFTLEDVENNLRFVHQIPGRIQAEAFDFQSGVELETTTDIGGGQNIGFLDPGDYLDYEVNVTTAGNYQIDYRTAAQFGGGQIQLQFIDNAGNVNIVDSPSFPSTGGWQTWTTVSSESIQLPVGRYLMRILITDSPFNMNWLDFSLLTNAEELLNNSFTAVKIFPNPSQDQFNIHAQINESQDVQLSVFNAQGQLIRNNWVENTSIVQEQVTLADSPAGFYFLILQLEDGSSYWTKLIKNEY